MYNIIRISDNSIVQSNLTIGECISWLNVYGNIIEYTIAKQQ